MNGYDMLSPAYDWLVKLVFGDAIEQSTTYFLDEINDGDDVLIVGGGTGWILEKINSNFIKVVYIDLSQKMIDKSKRRKISYPVDFICGSYTDIPDKQFNFIILPFFLDQFTTEKATEIISWLSKNLKSNGKLIFTDFIQHDSFRHKTLTKIMYLFFNLMGAIETNVLPDYERAISGLYVKEAEKSFMNGRILSRIYSLKQP